MWEKKVVAAAAAGEAAAADTAAVDADAMAAETNWKHSHPSLGWLDESTEVLFRK